MQIRIVGVVMTLALAVAGWRASAQDERPASLRPSPNRLLVKFAPGTDDREVARITSAAGAESVNLGPYADFSLLRFDGAPSADTLRALRAERSVLWAEAEGRLRTTMTAWALPADEDPLQRYQWAHRMINLPAARVLNFGSDPSVVIAVLDTGIAYLDTGDRAGAPDLAGTIIYSGYDFVSDDAVATDEGDGTIGHGTFLAGIIAQTTFNARGTSGIAFNAALLPVRVANRRGVARAADVARGIRYAVANGASLIVIGVAGPTDNAAVREAVEFAARHRVPVIAPAGNAPETLFPARYEKALSVGAVDAAGRRAWYSPERGPVDIYAPGGDLRPGIDADADGRPDGILAESFLENRPRQFAPLLMDGTSAAAAHAAGVSALLVSQLGPLDPDQLFYLLRSSAREVGDLPLLDAFRALQRDLVLRAGALIR